MITSPDFYKYLVIRIVIDSIAMYTYFRALKLEDVSYVIPLISILPIFTIGTSYLVNNQVPAIKDVFGIISIVVGTALLFSSKLKLRNMKSNKKLYESTSLILVTVIIWSFAEAIHKQAIALSSPATYFFLSYLGFTIVFSIPALFVYRKESKELLFNKEGFMNNLGQGIGQSFSRIFALNAVKTGLVSAVAAVRSTNIVFTAIFASIFLKEKISSKEIVGIGMCFLGILIMAF